MSIQTETVAPYDKFQTGGIVLCGGKSSRMGSPKAWLQFGDEVMLQRVTRLLATVVDPIIVVAAPGQEIPQLETKVTIIRDDFPELGPLSGIYSGLKELSKQQIEFGFVTACDCPFLKPDYVRFLINLEDQAHDIFLLQDGEFHHVLSAIYRNRLHETAKRLLDSNKLRPLGLTKYHQTRSLDVEQARAVDPELSSLVNLNSPEDYEEALRKFENC